MLVFLVKSCPERDQENWGYYTAWSLPRILVRSRLEKFVKISFFKGSDYVDGQVYTEVDCLCSAAIWKIK